MLAPLLPQCLHQPIAEDAVELCGFFHHGGVAAMVYPEQFAVRDQGVEFLGHVRRRDRVLLTPSINQKLGTHGRTGTNEGNAIDPTC